MTYKQLVYNQCYTGLIFSQNLQKEKTGIYFIPLCVQQMQEEADVSVPQLSFNAVNINGTALVLFCSR